MFFIPRALTCLALLCTWSASILAQDSPIRTFSKKWTIPINVNDSMEIPDFRFHEEMPGFSPYSRKYDDYMLYSVCRPKRHSNFDLCNVTIQSWPFARVNSLIICKNYEVSDPKLKVTITTRLSENNILFVLEPEGWYMPVVDGYYKIKLNILNMENCSNVAKISFMSKAEDKRKKPFKVLVFDTTFEIIVRNETYCNGMPACKISYDFNGNIIGHPKPFDTEENVVYFPVSIKSPDKGYYRMIVKNEILEVQHLNSSGKSRKIMSLPQQLSLSGSLRFIDINNELYTFCARHVNDSRELHCLQSDAQGMRLNVTIELPTYAKKLAIYNLAGGGILMIRGHCDVAEKAEHTVFDTLNCSEFQIQRIGADGHMFKPLVIDGFEETDVFKFHANYFLRITENDHNGFCFSMQGAIRPSYNIVKFGQSILYYKWCISTELIL